MSHRRWSGVISGAAASAALLLGLAVSLAPAGPGGDAPPSEDERAMRLVVLAESEAALDREWALALLDSERFAGPSAVARVRAARERLVSPPPARPLPPFPTPILRRTRRPRGPT